MWQWQQAWPCGSLEERNEEVKMMEIRPSDGRDSSLILQADDSFCKMEEIEPQVELMARKVLCLTDPQKSVCHVQDADGIYGPGDGGFTLDGSLGALLAVLAYRITFDCGLSPEELLHEPVKMLKKPSCFRLGKPGLADGGAGILYGAWILWKMRQISDQDLKTVMENAGQYAREIRKMESVDPVMVYGYVDFMHVIEKLPDEMMTDELLVIYEKLFQLITQESVYAHCRREDIGRLVQRSLVSADDRVLEPVRNETLRYGNAGKLMRFSRKVLEDPMHVTGEEVEAANRLCFHLCSVSHVVDRLEGEEPEAGLLHGLPGVLYSICRHMNPRRVPEIG